MRTWDCVQANIASVLKIQGEHQAALDKYNEALLVFEATLGRDNPVMATTHKNIGVVYGEQGKHSDALESFEKALAIEEQTFGREHPLVADTKNKCAAFFFHGLYRSSIK